VHRRALAALLLLVLTGCQARTDVAVHAAANGTGRVEVTVTLDKAAAARAAGTQPRTEDLTRAGWEVHPVERPEGGGLVYRAEKRFRSPDEAARVVREVSGSAFPGLVLRRERSFLKTRTAATGAIDLRAGAAAFGDPALTALLGGRPLGVDATRVAPLDQALTVQLTTALPGRTARWTARAGQRVPVAVEAEQWNLASVAFAVIALLALTAFGVSLRRALRTRHG
jgi:hypothetical protein